MDWPKGRSGLDQKQGSLIPTQRDPRILSGCRGSMVFGYISRSQPHTVRECRLSNGRVRFGSGHRHGKMAYEVKDPVDWIIVIKLVKIRKMHFRHPELITGLCSDKPVEAFDNSMQLGPS